MPHNNASSVKLIININEFLLVIKCIELILVV